MNSVLSLLMMLGLNMSVFAQVPEPYKELQFLSYTPNWVSVSEDETFQSVQQWDRYSRVLPCVQYYQPPAIIAGSHLYSALRTGTWDLEGFLLEKRNLQTGEIVWKKTHDMRNHSRQEAPFSLRINDAGELQLINYRRISPPDNPAFPGGFAGGGDASHLSIMEFDTASGDLVRHRHPASTDTTAAEIRQFYKYRTQLWHVDNDTFQWLTYHFDFKDKYPLSIGVYHSSFMHDGVMLRADSALHQYDTSAIALSDVGSEYDRRCFQYSSDSIYCINYIYSKSDQNKWFGRIDLYNQYLELLATRDVSDIIPFSKVNQLFHVSKDKILLYSTDYVSETDDRIISLDRDGNLNEVLYLKELIGHNSYSRTRVVENPHNDGLIIFSLDQINQKLYVLQSDGHGHLSLVRILETLLPSYVAYPTQVMFDSVNNNLVALLMHARFELVDDRYPVFHGNWAHWVSMPLDDFVDVTDQPTLVETDMSVYPNPTDRTFNIESDFQEGDQIKLFNTSGQLISMQYIDYVSTSVEVRFPDKTPAGVYIVKCFDRYRRLKATEKISLF